MRTCSSILGAGLLALFASAADAAPPSYGFCLMSGNDHKAYISSVIHFSETSEQSNYGARAAFDRHLAAYTDATGSYGSVCSSGEDQQGAEAHRQQWINRLRSERWDINYISWNYD